MVEATRERAVGAVEGPTGRTVAMIEVCFEIVVHGRSSAIDLNDLVLVRFRGDLSLGKAWRS